MPSVVWTGNGLTSKVRERLQDIERDFNEGKLTKKEYCKDTLQLLKTCLPLGIKENVQDLQMKFADFNLSENDYCEQLISILKSYCASGNDSPESKTANENEHDDCFKESVIDSDGIVNKRSSRSPRKGQSSIQITDEQESSSSGKESEAVSRTEASVKILETNRDSEHINDTQELSCNDSRGTEETLDSQSTQTFKLKSSMQVDNENGSSSYSKNNGCKNETIMSESSASDMLSKSFNSDKMESNSGIQKKEITCLISSEKSLKRKNEENDEMLISKRIKTKNCEVMIDSDDMKVDGEEDESKPRLSIKKKNIPLRCPTCRQLLDDPDLRLYQGHPNGAVEEFVALTDPRLCLFTGEEKTLEEGDERPQNKLTQFSVYDQSGHLCPFDGGLIEQNVLLYFSGYMKAIYEESSDIEGGVPTKDMGPINEWWVSGFDGGENALVGFSTAFGEYYLMEPSEEYAPYIEAMREKIFLSKLVIEFLLNEINPSYEDLLNKLQTTVPPKGITSLSEDSLLRHAQFVCDRVSSFDSLALAQEDLLITAPCMRTLVKLSGVTIGKRLAMRRAIRKDFTINKPAWTKATTTYLVQQNFESYFAGQLDVEVDNKGPNRRRCGVCEACQHPDCGTCVACSDMIKFGGTGRAKQACVKRRCPNMAIAEAEENDFDEEVDTTVDIEGEERKVFSDLKKYHVRYGKDQISWIGSPATDGTKAYYKSVNIDGSEFTVGDCVLIDHEPGTLFSVARLIYMFEERKGSKYFHGQMFCRGTDSVLGETADPQELFLVDMCMNFPIGSIAYKAKVMFLESPENWHDIGGQKNEKDSILLEDGKSFFYKKWYDPSSARFEDPKEESRDQEQFCSTCWKHVQTRRFRTPVMGERLNDISSGEVEYASLQYMGKEYQSGVSVYLKPNTFMFKSSTQGPVASKYSRRKEEKVDEDRYPEKYRKSDGPVKGSNEETPKPFCIGHIIAITAKGGEEFPMPNEIYFRLRKFYRPENTHKSTSLSYQADLNMLYWSDEEEEILLTEVVSTCYVVYGENIEEPLMDWTKKGSHRYYFNQAYNCNKQTFEEPPVHATLLGRQGKGKGKGKGKGQKMKSEEKRNITSPEEWPTVLQKLQTLDLFAGCGGLSKGLHEAGITKLCWAVEKEEPAANAFKLNNTDCTVFTEDCNLLLKRVLNGEKTDEKGQTLPKKGEVDLICGGPPCQGFSGMNRFNSREYSKFKNSLIVSFLSYCEYYRPKFIILENVRNFVSFKKSIILKLTLSCLLKVGYQCTFGILQAGNYGVPQTRRRLIIFGAAPGLVLPKYPEPTHVFSLRASHLSCTIDDKKYVSNCQWVDSAPYRTITVRDAMSDLPEIRSGHHKDELSYGGEPVSFFQRQMRGNQYQPILKDHICKDMAPIVEARMAHIPTAPGSDWRDLPNLMVPLSDGTFTKKLLYTHHDKKNGKSSIGTLRGVCVCATGKTCDPMDRQYNTLIPWCLPHTGNRHNHWAGLYGRLEWDGFFSTTVTNPEPMGKQGRVLHPEQNRVVSVRECARSQGFPDTYRFFGSILDKHRQVGNAVPPPMGAAIGYEIRKSLCCSPQNIVEQSLNV